MTCPDSVHFLRTTPREGARSSDAAHGRASSSPLPCGAGGAVRRALPGQLVGRLGESRVCASAVGLSFSEEDCRFMTHNTSDDEV